MNPAALCPSCHRQLPPEAPESLCPSCLLAGLLDDSAAGDDGLTATTGSRVRYLGDYELLREIGRGAVGVVYEARQSSLGRTVAVKLLLAGAWATEESLRRFRAEAQAAAAVRHPGIVTIHEIGEFEGQPYISMDLIEGQSLAEQLRAGPLEPHQAAQLVAQLAETVHFAHEKGIIHRDLKPSNVLLDPAGQPHITDFGLAKNLAAPGLSTLTGTVVGTPGYMPPEQVGSPNHKSLGGATAASDVYSLGAILYALLTGRPPFQGEGTLETVIQLLQTEAEPPGKLRRGLAKDLDTITLRCLQKQPIRRYASAWDLAQDLRAYLDGRPIGIGRSDWRPLFGRPMRRWATGLLVLGLVLALSWVAWRWISLERPAVPVESSLPASETPASEPPPSVEKLAAPGVADAEPRPATITESSPPADTSLATSGTLDAVAESPPSRPPSESPAAAPGQPAPNANVEQILQAQQSAREALEVAQRTATGEWSYSPSPGVVSVLWHYVGNSRCFSFSDDGTRLAVGVWGWTNAEGVLEVLSIPAGEVVEQVAGLALQSKYRTTGPCPAVLTSAEVRPLAAWNPPRGKIEQLAWKAGVDTAVLPARWAFSPTGGHLAAADPFGKLYSWDVASGVLTEVASRAEKLSFLDDRRLLYSSWDSSFVWDLEERQSSTPLPVGALLAHSPDGRVAVLRSNMTNSLTIWDLRQMLPRGTLFHSLDGPLSAALSDDGGRLVLITLKGDRRLQVWDLRQLQQPIFEINPHQLRLPATCCTDFSPDGRFLAVFGATEDLLGSVWIYDLEHGEELARLPGQHRPIWSPDGDQLATLGFGPIPEAHRNQSSHLSAVESKVMIQSNSVLLWDVSELLSSARAKP